MRLGDGDAACELAPGAWGIGMVSVASVSVFGLAAHAAPTPGHHSAAAVRSAHAPAGHESARGVCAVIGRQVRAWARGDAAGYARTFHGDVVLFNGEHLYGRTAVRTGMARFVTPI